jgi:drug/metabolite transporter (DMT)-like permease
MGASIGVLLFGDHLGLALGVGGLLIIAGSFIVVLGEKHQPPVTASAGPI